MIKLEGKVQTVLGLVDAVELGITLPHEHIFIDLSFLLDAPEHAESSKYANTPVSLDNLWWVRYHGTENRDNMLLNSDNMAIEELMMFKQQGGKTIVDLSSIGIGRDAAGLARVSRRTGLNIIMGTGYYKVKVEGPDFDRKSERDLADEMIAEIQAGIGNTGIRAGIIGELTLSWPVTDREKKMLRAAAQAQQQTGAAINIHPPQNDAFRGIPSSGAPLGILKILAEAGADLGHVVMSHLDRVEDPLPEHFELARTGCYIEYDLFGNNDLSYPARMGTAHRLCDRERIETIAALIKEGFLDNILVSHDIALKTKLTRYGGVGYGFILWRIVPEMLKFGITKEQIQRILVGNPARMLTLSSGPPA